MTIAPTDRCAVNGADGVGHGGGDGTRLHQSSSAATESLLEVTLNGFETRVFRAERMGADELGEHRFELRQERFERLRIGRQIAAQPGRGGSLFPE